MPGILQSSAFACRRSLLQPPHEAPSQRFVPPAASRVDVITYLIINDEI